jgi:hypothetical protein
VVPACSIINQAASPWPNLSSFNTAVCEVLHSPLANSENVGSTQQLRSYVSVHWAAILIWTNFSAHALASW